MAKARSTSKKVLTGKAAFHAIKAHGFRSGLEKTTDDQLNKAGVPHSYETEKLSYTVPARKAKYTPDFPVGNPVLFYIECKGYFRDAEERQKMILVKEQNPGIDIRFVLQNANKPIRKGSPTTHGEWCNQNGFKYSDKGIVPQEWLDEVAASRGSCPEAP